MVIDRTTKSHITLANDEDAVLTHLRQEFTNKNSKVNNAIDAENVRIYL
jgi:hypothetical protein